MLYAKMFHGYDKMKHLLYEKTLGKMVYNLQFFCKFVVSTNPNAKVK